MCCSIRTHLFIVCTMFFSGSMKIEEQESNSYDIYVPRLAFDFLFLDDLVVDFVI